MDRAELQAVQLALAFGLGLGLGFFYDFYRVWFRQLKGRLWPALGDIVWWLAALGLAFGGLYHINGAQLRLPVLLLAAAGVSVLFVMLSAKEAAILRVQGTTRFRTVLMLSLQQVFTCFAGLLAGLIGILLYIGGTRPDLLTGLAPGAALCAGLYLTAGVTGAAVSSAAVTGKNPLEMLQVKE